MLNFRFENQIERCGLLSVRFEGREADDECGIAVVLSAFETAAEPAEGSVAEIEPGGKNVAARGNAVGLWDDRKDFDGRSGDFLPNVVGFDLPIRPPRAYGIKPGHR